jgi:4-hydroxybenzoate polyprenyltransferase/phosphoserine phosphatase
MLDQRSTAVTDIPLVVDLDGTLIKVDSLHEAYVQLASTKPELALRVLFTLWHGRAAFKAAVADHGAPDVESIPVNESVLEVIKQAKSDGRRVYLATAADRRFAEAISSFYGFFDGIFATDGEINLKGKAKEVRLLNAFGAHGFDYIGNDLSDIPVWQSARTALVCGAPPRVVRIIHKELPAAVVLDVPAFSLRPYFLSLRPHQWIKNVLIALPAIAAHDFNISILVTVLIAFVSFSLGASGVYLVNDMLDVPHDRTHARKRHRPIAAGTVPLSHAVILLGLVASLSIALAFMLPWGFLAVLIAYFGLSMCYTLYLKRKLMIDVVALAALYGIRVLAGGAATTTILSHWLVGFGFFIFLNLALVKRVTEMMTLPQDSVEKIKGRGYRRADLQTMTGLTAAAGFVSVLVLALYINSPEVGALYRHPELLWGICVILVYWLGRVCLLTGRGEMEQDPILFAVTDRISLLAGLLVIAVFLVAL